EPCYWVPIAGVSVKRTKCPQKVIPTETSRYFRIQDHIAGVIQADEIKVLDRPEEKQDQGRQSNVAPLLHFITQISTVRQGFFGKFDHKKCIEGC
ncbi:MAG: hypothetical protein MN733_14045, partial [Nitrososphaera sp.]|nr:hypothetical protein [Nitrososphaera sp.]